MPHGQWVAFEPNSDVAHDCYAPAKVVTTKKSDYKNNKNIKTVVDLENKTKITLNNEISETITDFNEMLILFNEAIEKNIIMVPPSLLLVYYSTIKNAVETFSLQDKARDLIELHKVFLTQWEKYRKQIEGLQTSITSLQNKYDELTNVRSNELFKVVEKIDDLKFEDPED